MVDLDRIDLSCRLHGRKHIEQFIPHRGVMSLLDWIVWESPDRTRAVGLHHVRPDAFWVAGHFPARPIMPGVLMIEAGAQLACYMYNVRQPARGLVAFLRIDQASFRAMVHPGDDLYLMCAEVRFGQRRFVCDVQGMVNGRMAFDARVSGMQL